MSSQETETKWVKKKRQLASPVDDNSWERQCMETLDDISCALCDNISGIRVSLTLSGLPTFHMIIHGREKNRGCCSLTLALDATLYRYFFFFFYCCLPFWSYHIIGFVKVSPSIMPTAHCHRSELVPSCKKWPHIRWSQDVFWADSK